MRDFKYQDFKSCVDKFHKKKILVIGDLLLDEYIWGEVSRISPEAPVPVVWVKKETYIPGGSCNVASNLARLGADVLISGLVGDDARAHILKEKLIEKKIDIKGVIVDKKRPTSLKTRVIAHHQQVVRVDREDISKIEKAHTEQIINFVKNVINDIDAVIIEDYGKGVITPFLIKSVVTIARRKGKIIAVDPKEDHFPFYKKITVITPNNYEAEKAVGFKLDTYEAVAKAGAKLLKMLDSDSVLITLGERGMALFEKGKAPYRISTVAQEVFDVSGAGDTAIAVYTLAKSCGVTARLAAHISNYAAGVVVGKAGASDVTPEELLARIRLEAG